MLTLFHGEDITKSRNALMLLKNRLEGKEVRQLDGKTIQDDELIQALSSSSLFGGDTVVIIENLFSGLGRKPKRISQLMEIIVQQKGDVDIILWESKEVSKSILSNLPKPSTIQLFAFPTIIFQFLDALRPNANKQLTVLYHTLLQTEPMELIHAMLLKRLLLLIQIKQGDIPSMQSWQISRLTNQAHFFTINQLLALYKTLRSAELERNRGLAIFDLREQTELALALL